MEVGGSAWSEAFSQSRLGELQSPSPMWPPCMQTNFSRFWNNISAILFKTEVTEFDHNMWGNYIDYFSPSVFLTPTGEKKKKKKSLDQHFSKIPENKNIPFSRVSSSYNLRTLKHCSTSHGKKIFRVYVKTFHVTTGKQIKNQRLCELVGTSLKGYATTFSKSGTVLI